MILRKELSGFDSDVASDEVMNKYIINGYIYLHLNIICKKLNKYLYYDRKFDLQDKYSWFVNI